MFNADPKYTEKLRNELERDLQEPETAFRRCWQELSALLRKGSYWQARWGHTVPELESLELTTYEDYRECIDDAWDATVSPFTGEPLTYWTRSSGSTGKPKLYPLTAAYVQKMVDSTLMGSTYFGNEYPHITEGVAVIGPTATETSPAGVPVGFVATHVHTLLTPPEGPPFPHAVLADEETCDYWFPVFALSRDLGSFAGLVPSLHLQTLELIEQRREEYLAILTGDSPVPAQLGKLSVSPERVAHLRRVLGGRERLRLIDLWPSLEVVHVWQTSSAALHLDELRERAGPGPVFRDIPYGATEAMVTVIRSGTDPGATLKVGHELVEFLPKDAEPDKQHLLRPWELQVGELYETVFSSTAGFVRYRMGDLVRVSGFAGRTPMLQFHGRVGREIRVGMALIGETECVDVARRVGMKLSNPWVVTPNRTGNGLAIGVMPGDGAANGARFDELMGEVNGIYGHCQKTGSLEPCRVVTLSADHAVWKLAQPGHRQAKPRVLFDKSIE